MIDALHGFLGLPSDFDFLSRSGIAINAENIYSRKALADWSQHKISTENEVLLGYSMGGRLAMHMLLAQPGRWKKAVFVSANPGQVADRETRLKVDQKWAQNFLSDDWSRVVADWNKQDLFIVKNAAPDAINLPREEKNFDRSDLAWAIEEWSVARQKDLTESLSQLEIPILWVAGSEDKKYCELLKSLSSRRHQYVEISSAAHRAPWDHPKEFISKLKEFLAV